MTMTKKALIAGSFLAATAVAGAATAGAPVVYGKANISVQSNGFEDSNDDNITINSNASRLGVKGKHKLEGGLSAFYKAEYEINFDENKQGNGGSDFAARNIYAGIAGGFGAIQAGRFDTPVKKAQGKIDLFNDLYLGDIKNVTDRTYDADDRANNQIQYTSPKFAGGVKVKVALIAGEEDVNTNGANARDGVADGVQASVTYKAGDLYAAVAFGADHEANDEDVVRGVVQYKLGDATKLGLLLQTAEDKANDLEDTSVVFSAAHTVGKNTWKFQYGSNDQEVASTGATAEERTLLNVGVDHKLNKKTKVYAYYGSLEKDTGPKETDDTFAVGMEVKF